MTDTALAAATEVWAAEIEQLATAAGLRGWQREAVLLYVVDGWTPEEIRLKLRVGRKSDLNEKLYAGLALLRGVEGFWDACRQFERDLPSCAANREDYDERPEGLRGVAPDRASGRLFGMRVVAPDDARLMQDLPFAARLWALSRRPTREQYPNNP